MVAARGKLALPPLHGAGSRQAKRYLGSVVGVEHAPTAVCARTGSQARNSPGTKTVLCQIAGKRFEAGYDDRRNRPPVRQEVPTSGPTVASRGYVAESWPNAPLESDKPCGPAACVEDAYSPEEFCVRFRALCRAEHGNSAA